MDLSTQPPLNTLARVLCALVGLVLLSVAVAYVQRVPEQYWLGQLLWYAGQAIVALLLAFACGATRETLIGIAIGSAAYCWGFYLWVHSATHPEALAWLLYLFAAPGGWVMAMVLCWLERRFGWQSLRRLVISAVAILSALLATQAVWMLFL